MREYPDEYLEELAVYRKIARQMVAWDTILMHGSAIAVDEKGYLFTARSGTGKSTHTRLWRELLGERAVMINDDKPLLRIGTDSARVYGTPWNGKHHLGSNRDVPLHAICILRRATENRIKRIDRRTAYPLLLQQLFRPEDVDGLLRSMQLFDRLLNRTPIYLLGCNMEPEAAEIAFAGMNSEGAAL